MKEAKGTVTPEPQRQEQAPDFPSTDSMAPTVVLG